MQDEQIGNTLLKCKEMGRKVAWLGVQNLDGSW